MADYDYIIVGSGAGGAAAAWRLAQTGRRVLVIEKGRALPRDGSTLDFNCVISEGIFKSKEPWLDKDDRAFVPEEYFNLGGKTKWYGAALLRYDRHEFAAEPGFRCLPWPISYDDLAPYYTLAERLMDVRQFEIEPDLQAIIRRLNRSEWRAQPLPLGLSESIVADHAEATHFDGFASVKGMKADAQSALLDRAGENANLEVLTGDAAHELVGSAQTPERVTAVTLASGRRITADTVLLAAGAMHSPRLLQRYLRVTGLEARLPCARWVGRYFKRHFLTAMLGVSPSRKGDALRKTTVWVSDTIPHSSIQPLGFGGDVIATLMPRMVPDWIAKAFAERAYGFFLQTEDGSDERNRVIAANGDAGLPKLDYDAARLPQAVAEHQRMIRSFRGALLKAGYLSFAQSIGLAGTAHACGTLVAGADATCSVVGATGRVHGFENLYVVDGSILPRSSRVNPSLSIYAWALRVADLLTQGGVQS
ncbi:MAG: FAD-dependent oxidoreductase [Chromatiales bacterium]